MRNFIEERRQQLVDDELERILRKFATPEIRAIYCQNPLLKLLFDKRTRRLVMRGKSPYTKPIRR